MNESKKILSMLAEGKLTVNEASELLEALQPSDKTQQKHEKAAKRVKRLRIKFDGKRKSGKPAKMDFEIPLSLAKFVGKFVGKDRMIDIVTIEGEEINLNEIFETLAEDDLERGVILDMETRHRNDGSKAKIIVEVI